MSDEDKKFELLTTSEEKIKETGSESPAEITEEWVVEKIDKAKSEVLRFAKNYAREKIDKQVQTDKISLFTVFGIFASIISFLTIEFQFLKTLCSPEKIVGFSLLMFSLLLSFNVALDYLVKSRTEKKTPRPNIYFAIFVALTFALGIIFIYRGNEEVCKDNQIYERYSSQFDQNMNEYQIKIDQLQKQVDEMKAQK